MILRGCTDCTIAYCWLFSHVTCFWSRRHCRFARDISSGLSFIHSRTVIHLDIKPSNVVVSRHDDRCRLTDFGCSRRLLSSDIDPLPISLPTMTSHRSSSNRHLVTVVGGGQGTVIYRAPELLMTSREDRCSDKADVYSFGVLLWQLVSRRTPFAGDFDSPMAVMYNVVKYRARPDGSSDSPFRRSAGGHRGAFDWSCDSSLELDYVDVYRKCWDAEPDVRPAASWLKDRFDGWTTTGVCV